MSKFIALTSLWSMAIALSIAITIYGWGLEPKSWWWIIGGGVIGRMIIETMAAISKAEKS